MGGHVAEVFMLLSRSVGIISPAGCAPHVLRIRPRRPRPFRRLMLGPHPFGGGWILGFGGLGRQIETSIFAFRAQGREIEAWIFGFGGLGREIDGGILTVGGLGSDVDVFGCAF